MPTPRHKWANDGSMDFEYLDTVHGKKAVNPVMDDGRWDLLADDGEGEDENYAQDFYNARGRPDLSDDLGDA